MTRRRTEAKGKKLPFFFSNYYTAASDYYLKVVNETFFVRFHISKRPCPFQRAVNDCFPPSKMPTYKPESCITDPRAEDMGFLIPFGPQ